MSNVCAPTVGTPEVEWTQIVRRVGAAWTRRDSVDATGRLGTVGHRRSTGRDFPSNTNIGVTILVTVKG